MSFPEHLFFIFLYRNRLPSVKTVYSPARYLQAASPATAPSAAAVVSWRTSFVRQSPAAKTPGQDVRQSSDAKINPLSSNFIRS